jgi:DNA invertase Pin-like site-specific DNA recombinase
MPLPEGTTPGKTRTMTVYGYVRCSTDKQMVLQQIDALRAYGCEKIVRDKAVSGRTANRRGLVALKARLKPDDKFVVTAIDRGFRCTLDAIFFLDDVIRAGRVVFVSLREVIDTSTPEGRRRYIHAAADAEYERAIISVRTKEAMQALKRRGRKFGRPSKLNPKKHRRKIAWARRALSGDKPKSYDEVARTLRVSVSTVRRVLARACK